MDCQTKPESLTIAGGKRQADDDTEKDLHDLQEEELSGLDDDDTASLALSETDEDEDEGIGDGNIGRSTPDTSEKNIDK
jgi:hypothetical protein